MTKSVTGKGYWLFSQSRDIRPACRQTGILRIAPQIRGISEVGAVITKLSAVGMLKEVK